MVTSNANQAPVGVGRAGAPGIEHEGSSAAGNGTASTQAFRKGWQ